MIIKKSLFLLINLISTSIKNKQINSIMKVMKLYRIRWKYYLRAISKIYWYTSTLDFFKTVKIMKHFIQLKTIKERAIK